ncbi:MAG TPA: transglutaminaseTgpA domain-containing protein [Candidatus Angelobacter sp.]|nr:transglutaminaseTgpA domain-containing protein [Candidatus Angelobacter sp.]
MASIPAAARPHITIAEKFFQGSLYLLVVMGFCALASTSKLDAFSVVLVAFALLLRGYHLYRGTTISIPERLTSYLTLFYLIFFALDYFFLSQGFVSATVHMVLFIMVIKIFSVQRDRDLLYLAVLSFLMVLAAAVLTVDTIFLLMFFLFILTAMSTFVSMEMRRSERESRVVAISPSNANKFSRSLYGMVGILAVFTLGVAVVIFFVLPRMSLGGYLQSLGGQNDFVTGFSETVNLGGIGRIQQSNAPVMHVQVTHGTLPPDVKWRGVSLAEFDGHRWFNPPYDTAFVQRLHGAGLDLWPLRIEDAPLYSVAHRPTFGYRVIMEPVGSYIFFLASTPVRMSGPYYEVAVSIGGAVTKNDGGRSIDFYDGEADTTDPEPTLRNSKSVNYAPEVSLYYLRLPPQLDDRIRSLARTITASANSNYARALAIEKYLRGNFEYTLNLPGAEDDPLANFLFKRKKGHCEYFASSMAIMLRTLGIPARVVNGFRGGEFNEVNHTYVIRGRDAHSWVEAFFPEYGWVTFDPTPSTPVEGNDTLSRLAKYMDAMHEMWREWVINYDFSRQAQLSSEITAKASNVHGKVRHWYWDKYSRMLRWLGTIRGGVAAGNVVLIFVLGAGVIAIPFLPRMWRAFQRARFLKNPQQAPSTSASLWYARMLKVMARRGIRKSPAQTPSEFASAIDDPEVQRNVIVFTEHYERARFADSAEDASRLPQLYDALALRK